MADKKVSTTIEQMFTLINDADGDTQKLSNLIDALTGLIPIKKGKRMAKVDPNLNNTFNIKRIGCTLKAKIKAFDVASNYYSAEILNIECGTTKFSIGDIIMISKRELELTGKRLDIR